MYTLKKVPLGNYSCISELMLGGCNILKISGEIGSLKSLQYLDLSGNGFVSLPNSLDQLHELEELDLSYCENICSIPDLPMNVRSFRACYCTSLVNLPLNMSDLISLRKLHLDGCSQLGLEDPECLMKITESTELFELSMKNCNVTQVPTEIGDLDALQKLDLSGNTFSSFPDSLSKLSDLFQLKINDCAKLQFLPLLPSNLDVIEAHQCCSLDMMTFDANQMTYTFRTKVSEKSSPFTERLQIYLSGKDVPDWCSYQCNGPMLSFMAPVLDKKICGMILCVTTQINEKYSWLFTVPKMFNKTKRTSHDLRKIEFEKSSMCVMFYPLDATTLVVEPGDNLVLETLEDISRASDSYCGLSFIYEGDVVDSNLVIPQSHSS